MDHITCVLQYILSEYYFVSVIPSLNLCYLTLSGCSKYLFSILIWYRTCNRKLWLFAVLPSFPFFLFLLTSSLEQADLVIVLCYLIFHVRDLFLKFYICTDYDLQPSSISYFHLVQPFVFSSLLLSWMLDISYMGRVNIIFGYTSIVSPRLNCRLGNNLENTKKNMISL